MSICVGKVTKNLGSIRHFLWFQRPSGPLVSAEFLLDFLMGVRVGVDHLPEGNITIVNSHYRI